ncbi:MAG: DUF5686 and carboxypeptidase regulatory-like domain-containing protein [Bacteroidota bacterium]
MKALPLNALIILAHFLAGFSALGQATGIRGTVKNIHGEPIPFAAIYVAALHQGTTANEAGEYHLEIPPGKHQVRVQYLGYQAETETIRVKEGFIRFDVILEEQQYQLPAVVVTASGEDPAYYIMRRAIGMSQYYLNQVSEYSCRVYLKGTGVLTRVPALLRRQLEREGVEQDRYFVTETLSEVQFSLPQAVETRVLSTRSSGNDNQTSPMSFVTISLYRDINGIISPLSRSALQVYRFVLEGTFMENDRQINRIRVVPRRPGPDLYSGVIHIAEGSWNLHSVDLSVEQSFFTINFRQVYNPVEKDVWMPVSQDFNIDVALMGLEANYKYLASVTDYQVTLNPDLDHDFYRQLMKQDSELFLLQRQKVDDMGTDVYRPEIAKRTTAGKATRRQQRIAALMAKPDLGNREMRTLNRLIRKQSRAATPRPSLEIREFSMEIDDSARVRTDRYWQENRPVPLTDYEEESFDGEKENEEGDTEKKEPALAGKVITGYAFDLENEQTITYGGLIDVGSTRYNTVDGFVYGQWLNYDRTLAGDKQFNATARAGWAFARQQLLGSVGATYHYDPFRRAYIRFTGGWETADFATNSAISPFFSTVSGLFFGLNPAKFYHKEFIGLSHETDLANGLVLTTSADYSRRKPLENHSAFSITNFMGKEFTPNVPAIPGLFPGIMPGHTAFIASGRLSYTHRYYWARRGASKQMLYSHFPTISLYYRQGFGGVAGSDVQFSQVEASVNQTINIRLVGNISYRINAGMFPDTESIHAPDFRHFATSPFIYTEGNAHSTFRTLPLYEYSTTGNYLSGYFQYDHARILLKRLPFLSRTLMREKLFFNALAVETKQPWWEAGYGVSQIFLLFDVEVVAGFRGGQHQYTGFRISTPIASGMSEIRL